MESRRILKKLLREQSSWGGCFSMEKRGGERIFEDE